MGKVWIQASAILHVEKDGRRGIIRPGDWAEVGRHDARRWMAEGKCTIHKLDVRETVQDLYDCAVSLRGKRIDAVQEAVRRQYPSLDIKEGFYFPSRRMLFWDTSAKMRAELVMVGLNLLKHGWQVAVPLMDYDTLARDVGDEEDRARTEEMLHDLRVPVYDTHVIFARRCEDTINLLEIWQEEKGGGGHDGLAFLRSLHRVKPLVNALPPFWTE